MHRRGFVQALIGLPALAGFHHHAGPAVWPLMKVGDLLELRRESHNRHDAKAVAVRWRGRKIGYVPRAENDAVSRLMDQGCSASATITRLCSSHNPWRRVRMVVTISGGGLS